MGLRLTNVEQAALEGEFEREASKPGEKSLGGNSSKPFRVRPSNQSPGRFVRLGEAVYVLCTPLQCYH